MRIILLRHGQSQWNLENRFTGWKDVMLTAEGIEEAKYAGNAILKNNISIQSIHTSILTRAVDTSNIVSNIIGFDKNKIVYDWRLNERHYGALEGLNKSETAGKYGEKQVLIWRRSFSTPPPLLKNNDFRHPKNSMLFKDISIDKLPSGESLKDVIIRLNPFWEKFLKNVKQSSQNHLIVAHSNSLRAIVKILENLSEEEILNVNIPTGIPLVYELDTKFNIIMKNYLIDSNTLKEKQALVENQGKK